MNKIKIDNYYKPESKTLILDEIDYTIIPNSDIKPLLDKLQQENKQLKKEYNKIQKAYESTFSDYQQLKDKWNKLKEYLHNVDVVVDYSENYDGRFINYDELIDKMQELEGSDGNE